ncbi:hypothetical protein ACHHYP_20534 [Achlya hypogyna]|uniref:Uncharacterized protein n=1 Tax=Achlya hypogyna TaxID=1202772 RepID=A0A1V9YJG0_ACHHY|nr:hypothetical protein ACHHYP_20534 [Achlya hypogyna]
MANPTRSYTVITSGDRVPRRLDDKSAILIGAHRIQIWHHQRHGSMPCLTCDSLRHDRACCPATNPDYKVSVHDRLDHTIIIDDTRYKELAQMAPTDAPYPHVYDEWDQHNNAPGDGYGGADDSNAPHDHALDPNPRRELRLAMDRALDERDWHIDT